VVGLLINPAVPAVCRVSARVPALYPGTAAFPLKRGCCRRMTIPSLSALHGGGQTPETLTDIPADNIGQPHASPPGPLPWPSKCLWEAPNSVRQVYLKNRKTEHSGYT
jgi:hypothetical protein